MKSIYDGHGCTADAYRNKLEPVFNAILRQWHKLSEQEGFKYALAFGTYIAWLRHESYIPWDYDLDVYVGRDSLQTLMNLAETRPDWCMSPQDFQVRPRPTDKKSFTRLIFNPHHAKPIAQRPKYSCTVNGGRVPVQIDSCSFNGPLARLVHFDADGRKLAYLDVFLFDCPSKPMEDLPPSQFDST